MKRVVFLSIVSIIFFISQPSYGSYISKFLPKLTALSGLFAWQYKDALLYQQPPSYDIYGDKNIIGTPEYSFVKIDLQPHSILDKHYKHTVVKTEQIASLGYVARSLCQHIPWWQPYGTLKNRLETNKTVLGSLCFESTFGSVLGNHPPVEIQKFAMPGPFYSDDEKRCVTKDLLTHVITHTQHMHRGKVIACPKLLVRDDTIVEESLKNQGFVHLDTKYIRKARLSH